MVWRWGREWEKIPERREWLMVVLTAFGIDAPPGAACDALRLFCSDQLRDKKQRTFGSMFALAVLLEERQSYATASVLVAVVLILLRPL